MSRVQDDIQEVLVSRKDRESVATRIPLINKSSFLQS